MQEKDDKGKNPTESPNEWVTIAKKAKPPSSQKQVIGRPTCQKKWYVVFAGFQPGIYTTWRECHFQVNKFPGACFKSYDSMEEAKQALSRSGKMPPVEKLISKLMSNPDKVADSFYEINDFFNPGVPLPIYENLNGAWKAHIAEHNKQFRVHMSNLAKQIAEQTADFENQIHELNTQLENFKQMNLQIISTVNWDDDFSLEQITCFRKIVNLLKQDCTNPNFHRINRICLLENLRKTLSPEHFIYFTKLVEDHDEKIFQILSQHLETLNDLDRIPKITIFCYEEPWSQEVIDWGLTNKIIFQSFAANQWQHFPAMIKTMVTYACCNWRWPRPLSFWISSSVGWREKTRFFQPYQIWYLKNTTDTEFVPPTLENAEDLVNNLDLFQYAVDNLIDLKQNAKRIRDSTIPPFMITDGRRIFVTQMSMIAYDLQSEHLFEAQMLLDKIISYNLDLPMDLLLAADETEKFRQQDFAQPIDEGSDDSGPDMDEYEIHNLTNALDK